MFFSALTKNLVMVLSALEDALIISHSCWWFKKKIKNECVIFIIENSAFFQGASHTYSISAVLEITQSYDTTKQKIEKQTIIYGLTSCIVKHFMCFACVCVRDRTPTKPHAAFSPDLAALSPRVWQWGQMARTYPTKKASNTQSQP